ncbi:NAD(P)-binding protein [Calocera viscosa TUFC12733]|uniref:NAD(P)-binding protein n=1 Tax=Calocera viscosa (strain TUFC12733) TaxID=1330018 RepID=A0A167S1B9_CALVF|nr:NAD(P)-binding protein [Calocera viscosa TUFC12733]
MSPSPVVFVDGANGFVGTAIVLEAIKQGYKVKAAVVSSPHDPSSTGSSCRSQRRQESADAFAAKYPELVSHVEWVFVTDLTDQKAVNAAVQGADYLIHVASPFTFSFKDAEKDILIPARENTLVALRAAAQNPQIKHVVITSSFAAICDVLKGYWPEKTYSEKDWNPATWDEAVKSDNGAFVYCASKEFAEQTAWDFIEKEKPGFSLTTLCPPMVFGPPQQPFTSLNKLNESVDELWQLFSGKAKEITFTGFPGWVDVRDLAYLHVAALTNPKAKNQRYLVTGGFYSFDQAVVIAREAFPEQAARMTPSTGKPADKHYELDASKTVADFGIKWTPFNKTIVDTAGVLFKAEAQLAAA